MDYFILYLRIGALLTAFNLVMNMLSGSTFSEAVRGEGAKIKLPERWH